MTDEEAWEMAADKTGQGELRTDTNVSSRFDDFRNAGGPNAERAAGLIDDLTRTRDAANNEAQLANGALAKAGATRQQARVALEHVKAGGDGPTVARQSISDGLGLNPAKETPKWNAGKSISAAAQDVGAALAGASGMISGVSTLVSTSKNRGNDVQLGNLTLASGAFNTVSGLQYLAEGALGTAAIGSETAATAASKIIPFIDAGSAVFAGIAGVLSSAVTIWTAVDQWKADTKFTKRADDTLKSCGIDGGKIEDSDYADYSSPVLGDDAPIIP